MDFIRTAGVQTFRLWADSDELTEVRWYRAGKGAAVIPYGTRYSHPAWTMDRGQWQLAPWDGGKPSWDSGADLLQLPGDHVCGSADAWLTGGVHGRDPLILTDDEGNAECCGGQLVYNTGGLGLASESLMSSEVSWQACGDGSNTSVYTVAGSAALRLRFFSINATDDGGAPYTWTLSTSKTGETTCVILSGEHTEDWETSVWDGELWIPGGRTVRVEVSGPAADPHWYLSGEVVTL